MKNQKDNMKNNISEFDTTKEFVINEYLKKDMAQWETHAPCKIRAGIFIFCTQGHLKANINLATYTIKAFDFITLLPNSFVRLEEVSEDVHLYAAIFSSRTVNHINYVKSVLPFYNAIMSRPVLPLPDTMIPLYQEIYRLLMYGNEFPCTQENKNIIAATLTIFIEGVAELYKNHNKWREPLPKRDHGILYEFIQLIMKYYTSQHTSTFYAQQLGITLPHFCTTIKKITRRTPLEIIAIVITIDAKTQLKMTDIPVKEIALSLGFHNLSFFNKYFKKHTGITPQEYRRRERTSPSADALDEW